MRALASTCSRVRLRASRPHPSRRHATRAGTAAGTLCGGRLDRVPPARAGAAADGAGDSRARDDRLGWPARACTHPCHICTGTGCTRATSAPGLGSPVPHLHRDLARPCHICTGTGPNAAISAPGLGHICTGYWGHPCDVCTGTGPPLPHLHRDLACAQHGQPQPLRGGGSGRVCATPARRRECRCIGSWRRCTRSSSTRRGSVGARAHAPVSCGCARA